MIISNNSSTGYTHISGTKTNVSIDNSIVRQISLTFDPASITNLEPGQIGYWNLHENETVGDIYDITLKDTRVLGWNAGVGFESEQAPQLTFQESTLKVGLSFHDTSVNIENLNSGYCDNWNLGSFDIKNCTILGWEIGLQNTSGKVVNCQSFLLDLSDKSDISVENSTFTLKATSSYGRMGFNDRSIGEAWGLHFWLSAKFFLGHVTLPHRVRGKPKPRTLEPEA